MYKKVPLSMLSHVYFIVLYHNNLDVVNFEVHGNKTSLSTSSKVIHPDSIIISHVILMFHQMGYNSDLSQLSKFKNYVLPLVWNALFAILFKCLSERITSFDGARRTFYTLIYGLFYAENVDYRTIILSEFTQNMSFNTKDSEISYAKFWSIVVR